MTQMSSSVGEGTFCFGVSGVDGVLGVRGESDGIVTEGVPGVVSGSGSLIFTDMLLTMTDSFAAQGEIATSSFLLSLRDVIEDSTNPFCALVVV